MFWQVAERRGQRKTNSLLPPGDDLTEMRVDDLAVVPPTELYDILLRASPEQIAKIALKFNDRPSNSHSTGAIAIFFQAWAELDPAHALEGAFRLKDARQRTDAVNVVTGSASPGAAPELAKALADQPDDDSLFIPKGRFLRGLVEKWAWVDPSAAARFLSEVKGLDDQFRLSTAGDIAHAWASVDPSAALAWIDQLGKSDSAKLEVLFGEAIDGWFQSDPNAATRYLSEHLDSPGSVRAASVITGILFKERSDAATEFLQNLPAGETKETVENKFGTYWAGKDPVAAAHWLENLPEKEQSVVVDGIAGSWSTKDWPAASKVGGWAKPATFRDSAVAAVVNRAPAGVSPPEYLPLVLSIKDSET